MFENENSNLSEHLVTINRVTKVVKGALRNLFANWAQWYQAWVVPGIS